MQALIAGEADPNIRDNSGKTALAYAYELVYYSYVKKLMDMGAVPGNELKDKIAAITDYDKPIEIPSITLIGSYIQNDEQFYIFKIALGNTVNISATQSDNGWSFIQQDEEAFYLSNQGIVYKIKK